MTRDQFGNSCCDLPGTRGFWLLWLSARGAGLLPTGLCWRRRWGGVVRRGSLALELYVRYQQGQAKRKCRSSIAYHINDSSIQLPCFAYNYKARCNISHSQVNSQSHREGLAGVAAYHNHTGAGGVSSGAH